MSSLKFCANSQNRKKEEISGIYLYSLLLISEQSQEKFPSFCEKFAGFVPGSGKLPAMEPQPNPMNDQAVLRLAKTIWAALFASLFMYLVVAFQMGGLEKTSNPSPEEIKQYEYLFSICAVVSFLAAIWLPRIVSRAISFRRKEGSPKQLAQKFPPYLIRLALFESVGLFGFVLAVLTASGEKMWPFLFVSAFGFLISFPSQEKLEGL